MIAWAFTGLYRVDQAERGVVQRFGAYTETTYPGLHWHIPYIDERVKHKYFTLTKSGKSDHRLVIDLEKLDSLKKRNNISLKKNQGRKIIVVIDPGHGGKDPGAIGPNGTRESNVVLPPSSNKSFQPKNSSSL